MSTPRRGRRSISDNVWILQNALAKILNDNDRTYLIHSLNQYQKDRDVLELVTSLKRVLDSPKKREVYPLLRDIIPSNDKRYFERAWYTNQPHHTSSIPPEGSWNNSTSTRSRSRSQHRQPVKRYHHLYSSLPENLDKCDSGVDLPALKKSSSSRSIQKYPIRRLYLKRAPGTGYGFCMRGGSEHGVGLYVSSVDDNSIAEYEGLLSGDHILSVNEIQFDGLSHDQAVKIIKNNKKLNMVVRSVGRIPNTFIAESTYKWIDPRGQRVSPPPNVDSNGREMSIDGIHRSDLRLLGDDDERKVNVFIEEGDKLGLRIRGGSEYGLGIYIAGVDPNSAAEKAGLKCGDQIMDVNGISFLNISHADAVKVLKSAKNMMVTMKDVGRLPFAKTVTDKTRWTKGKLPAGRPVQSDDDGVLTTTVQIHMPPENRRHTTGGSSRFESQRAESSKFRHGIAGSQLLYNGSGPSTKSLAEDQAKQILNENELGTMSYYMDEYSKGFISVDAFVLALFSLFNTPAKVSLLSEVRGFIHPRDIDRFDDLVLKKEIEAIKKRKVISPPDNRDDTHSIHSYSSSVSSYSEHGSSSSRNSAKDSLDSRPITPPRVPEVLPDNMKVVQNDLGKVMSKHTHEKKAKEALTKNDDTLNNSRDSTMPSPPSDFTTIFPLSSSSPCKPKHDAVTNGEITKYLVVGDNARVKDASNKKRDSKKSQRHSEKREKSSKKSTDDAVSEKEHARTKNDSQSSSDHSFELIPETKKEKRGFFLHHNKGSYSPYKHDHSSTQSKLTSSNLYHVTVVKKKNEDAADTSLERPVAEGARGEQLENDFEKAHSSLPSDKATAGFIPGENESCSHHSENTEETYDESTLVHVDDDDYALPSTVMNGYCGSQRKLDATKHSMEKQPSDLKAPLKPKPYHAKTEDQTKEGYIANISFEGKQSLKDSSQSVNSAFAPPKPKPYISQATDRAARDSLNDNDDSSKGTQRNDESRTSVSPQNSQYYASMELYRTSKESRDFDEQYNRGHQGNEYVDIYSIKRAKKLSRQEKKTSEKNIESHENEHDNVMPIVMGCVVESPPPLPTPYSSTTGNTSAPRNVPNDSPSVYPDVEKNFYTSRSPLAISPISENPTPMLEAYSSKSKNSVSEEEDSSEDYRGYAEAKETRLERRPDGASPVNSSYSPRSVEKIADKNNNPPRETFSNGRKVGPTPKVFDLINGDKDSDGMYLAMEETATTRSGKEKSTSWGEEVDESLLSLSSLETYYETKPSSRIRELDSVKTINEENFANANSLNIENSALDSHDNIEIKVGNKNIARLAGEERVTTEDSFMSHTSPIKKDVERGVEGTPYFGLRGEIDSRTYSVTEIRSHPKQVSVTTPEGATKNHATDQKEVTFRYDVNQNLEEPPKTNSVKNMIVAYNRMSDASDTGKSLSRRGSTSNRKSWDGVGNPSKTGQVQETSVAEKKKSLKSNSDSNLMNLPKDQQKNIQVKLRVSQELFDLHQQSRGSSTNNSRRSSVEVSLPTEPPSPGSQLAKPIHSQLGEGSYVEIEKSPKGLGLTLEGGSDSSSRNAPVKIKLIKEGPYAAYTCGKLRSGQTILQINDTPMQGMTNAMAILTLRQAYSDPETKTLMLVIKDP